MSNNKLRTATAAQSRSRGKDTNSVPDLAENRPSTPPPHPLVMSSYRRFSATFPFEARDDSELSMSVGDTLVVAPLTSGEWPNADKWMKGANEQTGREGEFPGTYVEFEEEFSVQPEPPPLPDKELATPPPITPPPPLTLPDNDRGSSSVPEGETPPPTPPRRVGSASLLQQQLNQQLKAQLARQSDSGPPPPRPRPRVKRPSTASSDSGEWQPT